MDDLGSEVGIGVGRRQKISFSIVNGTPDLNRNLVAKEMLPFLPIFYNLKNGKITLITTTMDFCGVSLETDEKTAFLGFYYNKFQYLKINGKVIRDKRLVEIYSNVLIYRHFDTFFHSTYEEATIIHHYVIRHNTEYKQRIFIGGEMYYYGKALGHPENQYYSDNDSIIEDTKYNNPLFADVRKIDYSTDKLSDCPPFTSVVINTGPSGLGENLCLELLRLPIDKITIISCRERSFNRDLRILIDKFVYDSSFKVGTANVNILSLRYQE